jgi:hypothetical protein
VTRTLRALLCLSLPSSLFISFPYINQEPIDMAGRTNWDAIRGEERLALRGRLHLYRSMYESIVLQGLREHGVRVFSSDMEGLMDTTTEGSEAGSGSKNGES